MQHTPERWLRPKLKERNVREFGIILLGFIR